MTQCSWKLCRVAALPNRAPDLKTDTVVWCRVSGSTIQAQGGVFSHSGATIILNYYCPCGVTWSWKMSHKNSSKLFVSLPFLLLPSFYFLALFFSIVAFLSLSSLQMALWSWIHQVCKLPPRSDTSLAESTGNPAGIVRVKLKNNKTCQCRFPSRGARHQWVLKKTAVALLFPFLQLARTRQSIHCLPPFSYSGLCQDQRIAGISPGPKAAGIGTGADGEQLYSI